MPSTSYSKRVLNAALRTSHRWSGIKTDSHPIQFSSYEWSQCQSDPIFEDWYKTQTCHRFREIEYCKELKAPFFHEFTLLHLADGSFCRFERLCDPVADRTDALSGKGAAPWDVVQTIQPESSEMATIRRESKVIAHAVMPHDFHVKQVLAVCWAICADENASRYTLTMYNCYFFTWAIFSVFARAAATVEQATEQKWNRIWPRAIEAAGAGPSTPEHSLARLVFRLEARLPQDEPVPLIRAVLVSEFANRPQLRISVRRSNSSKLWESVRKATMLRAIREPLMQVADLTVKRLTGDLEAAQLDNEANFPLPQPDLDEVDSICQSMIRSIHPVVVEAFSDSVRNQTITAVASRNEATQAMRSAGMGYLAGLEYSSMTNLHLFLGALQGMVDGATNSVTFARGIVRRSQAIRYSPPSAIENIGLFLRTQLSILRATPAYVRSRSNIQALEYSRRHAERRGSQPAGHSEELVQSLSLAYELHRPSISESVIKDVNAALDTNTHWHGEILRNAALTLRRRLVICGWTAQMIWGHWITGAIGRELVDEFHAIMREEEPRVRVRFLEVSLIHSVPYPYCKLTLLKTDARPNRRVLRYLGLR
jgi:hypothetical protein